MVQNTIFANITIQLLSRFAQILGIFQEQKKLKFNQGLFKGCVRMIDLWFNVHVYMNSILKKYKSLPLSWVGKYIGTLSEHAGNNSKCTTKVT